MTAFLDLALVLLAIAGAITLLVRRIVPRKGRSCGPCSLAAGRCGESGGAFGTRWPRTSEDEEA